MIDLAVATASRTAKLRAAEDLEISPAFERINFPVTIDFSQAGFNTKLHQLNNGKRTVFVDSSFLRYPCCARYR